MRPIVILLAGKCKYFLLANPFGRKTNGLKQYCGGIFRPSLSILLHFCNIRDTHPVYFRSFYKIYSLCYIFYRLSCITLLILRLQI